MATKHGKGWRARWIDADGRRQSETFRTRREAESFELRKKSENEEIRLGLRVRPPSAHSFDELCDTWLRERAPQKRSADDDRSIIRAHLRPFFGATKLQALDSGSISRFVTSRDHLAPKTVGNLLTLLVAMLNHGRDLGWLERVPRIHKPRTRHRDFRYLRTQSEIQRFLAAARHEGEQVEAFYTAAVCTGLRAGELAGLHWADVDFDRRLITVHHSYNGPTKADDVRYVPILDALLPTLRAWRAQSDGPLVFTNRQGRMFAESARIYQEVLHRVLERAKFPRAPRGGRVRGYVTFHDLRHTFASHWVMAGGDLFRLQKILGHKSVQMTMRYAHLAPDAFAGDYSRLPDFRSPE